MTIPCDNQTTPAKVQFRDFSLSTSAWIQTTPKSVWVGSQSSTAQPLAGVAWEHHVLTSVTCQGECQGLCHQQVAQGWLSPQTGSELRLLLLPLELLREGLLLKTFQSYPGELHDVISVSAPVPELHLSSYKRDCCTYYGNVIYLFYTTGKFKGNHFTSVLCRLECSQ